LEILRVEESKGWLEEMGAEVEVMSLVAPHPVGDLDKPKAIWVARYEGGERKVTLGSQSRSIGWSWNQSRKSPHEG